MLRFAIGDARAGTNRRSRWSSIPQTSRSFNRFLRLSKPLRGPDGCPWDKEQTHRTLTPFAIEEAHELAEAVENENQAEMISELGDLLLQVVLHAEIGRQAGSFDIHDVVQAISEKMVRRHPHVFSDTKAETSTEVLNNWAEIKATEKKLKPAPADRFDVSPALPALARAQKIGDKTKRLRFDWSTPQEVMAKVDEEILEVKEELAKGVASTPEALEHEIGDVLFSVAQLARHLDLDAEQCLRSGNRRFETRFFKMREQIAASGRAYETLSTQELEQAWQNVKASLKQT